MFFTIITFFSLSNGQDTEIYKLAKQFLTPFLDNKNPSRRHLSLFKRLLDLYKNGQLLIHEAIIKAVMIIEGNAFYRNFKYESASSMPETDPCVARFIKRFIQNEYITWGDFEVENLEYVHVLIKKRLELQGFELTHSFISRLFASLEIRNGEIIFDEHSLIEAYFHIPKPQRVLVNFFISFLARYIFFFFLLKHNKKSRLLLRISTIDESEAYLNLLTKLYGTIIIRFKMKVNEPKNLNLIKQKALEAYIKLYKSHDEIFSECERKIDYFLLK